VVVLGDQVEFKASVLASELRGVFAELREEIGEQEAYSCILNYIIFRMAQDTGAQLEYSLKECPGQIQEDLRRLLDRRRYDFSKAAEQGLLGEVYESFLDRETRKRLGLFYTPESVIGFILDSTLGQADVVENPYLRVIDPACGSGYFLLKAYDQLRRKFEENEENLVGKYGEAFRRENIHRHIIENCIFGADVDELGAMLTKAALALKDPTGGASPNIAVCDSLVRWEDEEDPVLASFWSRGFDYIVGNPPWVSLSRKHGTELPQEKLDYYRESYKGNSYLPNLYEYFLKRSLELVREGGAVGLLIPDRFAKNKQFAGFRRKLLADLSMKALMFGISMEGVIADSMAMVVEKKDGTETMTEVHSKGTYFRNPQGSMLSERYCTFASYCIEDCEASIEKLQRDSVPLGQVAKSFTGFIGIKDRMSLARVDDSQASSAKGEDIARYRVNGGRYYDISPDNIIGGTKDRRKLLAKEKLLVRKTGKRLVAAMDREGVAPEQSLYGLIMKDSEFKVEYVLAVLNSSLMEEYYSKFLVTNENSTPQLKKMDLDRIPIKRCSAEKQEDIALIVQRLEREYSVELKEKLDFIINEIYGV
jgi:hypothetical protein